MQVLATLLTEVFFWTGGLIHDTNTASVLPDFAAIALYEPSSGVFGESSRIWVSLGAALGGITDGHRQPGVLLVSTNASCHLFFTFVLDPILNCICSFTFDVVLATPRPSRLRFSRDVGVLGRLRSNGDRVPL